MKKSKWAKLLSLCLTVVLIAGLFAACGGDPSGTGTTTSTPADSTAGSDAGTDDTGTDDAGSNDAGAAESFDSFPRNETLYMAGIAWGISSNFNPFSSDPGFGVTVNTPVQRLLIYETLFMYNSLDGKLYGLLADEYNWNDNVMTITLKEAAHWNDGTPFTAEDVVYTYEFAQRYDVWTSAIWSYIDSIEATDDYTVVITGKSGSDFNPKEIEKSISAYYMIPKHAWEGYEADLGGDLAALMQMENFEPIASGPYTVFSNDETKIAHVRDDNYWGQDDSMWGKLPAPKYVVHNIFKDNPAGDAALKAGQVDVSQQFISQVWKMWEDGAAVQTYLSELPYYLPGQIPSIIFNTTKAGLDDKNVRKAIAMVLDYDMIGQNAMSGYTAKMSPSLMLPTDTEQALIDADALKPYQWEGVDIEGATALLEEAGWTLGSDGVREKDGNKLSFQVECPTGWTDWMAALEVVSQSTKAIGIDIQTYFPEQSVYTNDRNTGEFDIIMLAYPGGGIANPWSRSRDGMSSTMLVDIGQTAYGNYGRWENARATEIIEALVNPASAAEEKELWTELNTIYLEEMPYAGLMYRPRVFHTVNTSVWDGFPEQGDGTNIGPDICVDGYGIAALYNITAK